LAAAGWYQGREWKRPVKQKRTPLTAQTPAAELSFSLKITSELHLYFFRNALEHPHPAPAVLGAVAVRRAGFSETAMNTSSSATLNLHLPSHT